MNTSDHQNKESPMSKKIECIQIAMGHGLVDVGPIIFEGRVGLLLHPRGERIPVGDPGTLQNTNYCPQDGDVVIWIDSLAGAEEVIDGVKEAMSLLSVESDT